MHTVSGDAQTGGHRTCSPLSGALDWTSSRGQRDRLEKAVRVDGRQDDVQVVPLDWSRRRGFPELGFRLLNPMFLSLKLFLREMNGLSGVF